MFQWSNKTGTDWFNDERAQLGVVFFWGGGSAAIAAWGANGHK